MDALPAEKRMPTPLQIHVDDRESSGPVLARLRECPGFRVTVTRLPLGDYRVGRFVFERKTLPDLAASIISGRLFAQASRLAAMPLRPAVILEGAGRGLAESGMRWEAIQGALVSVTVFYGIPLLRTRSPDETVQTMLFVARQAAALASGALPRPGYRPRGKRARQLFILQGLPRIGPERARRLLERFGSVEAVMTAKIEDLRGVPGVGRQIAAGLRWSLEEPRHEYLLPRRACRLRVANTRAGWCPAGGASARCTWWRLETRRTTRRL